MLFIANVTKDTTPKVVFIPNTTTSLLLKNIFPMPINSITGTIINSLFNVWIIGSSDNIRITIGYMNQGKRAGIEYL